MRKLAAGNWKMNGLRDSLSEIGTLSETHASPAVDVLICPPATLITPARAAATASIAIGAQDCHAVSSGAHTGDIAAEMLVEAGASAIIVGHSERRSDHAETDAMVKAKAEAAIGAGAIAIVCLGETLEEREAGSTISVVAKQLAGSLPDGATAANTVIAYEPVWAIGTGKVATPEQIAEVHEALRIDLQDKMADGSDVRILYGGSVKAANATEIFALPNVDGALVGGASLTAEQFSPIITALEAAS
ncbi:triose-phosphate isomerase [Shimia ponticola]|uniref:triose-phosphate isomerase n=1 Tax=Shimia ponticola TaxID=2582893 RepID=UPI00164BEF60|nr:triose-phosphate isomerase [Shimia ponticola]